ALIKDFLDEQIVMGHKLNEIAETSQKNHEKILNNMEIFTKEQSQLLLRLIEITEVRQETYKDLNDLLKLLKEVLKNKSVLETKSKVQSPFLNAIKARTYSDLNLASTVFASERDIPLNEEWFVPRPSVEELLEQAVEEIGKRHLRRLFILLGSAGYGKTWIISKFALQYHAQGNCVFYFTLRDGFEFCWEKIFGQKIEVVLPALKTLAPKLPRPLLLILDGLDEIDVIENNKMNIEDDKRKKDWNKPEGILKVIREHILTTPNIMCVLTCRIEDWKRIAKPRWLRDNIWTRYRGDGFSAKVPKFSENEQEKAAKQYLLPPLELWPPKIRNFAPYPFWWNLIKQRTEELGLLPHPVDRELINKFFIRMRLEDYDKQLLEKFVYLTITKGYSWQQELPIDILSPEIQDQLPLWSSAGLVNRLGDYLDPRIQLTQDIFGAYGFAAWIFNSHGKMKNVKAVIDELDHYWSRFTLEQQEIVAAIVGQLLKVVDDFRDWVEEKGEKYAQKLLGIIGQTGIRFRTKRPIEIKGKEIEAQEAGILLGWISYGIPITHLGVIDRHVTELALRKIFKPISKKYSFSNPFPKNIKEFKNLKSLSLRQNGLDTVPRIITQLTNLQVLNLGQNQLKSLPESFGNLKNLKELDLSDNRLSAFPEILRQLVRLKNLNLEGNRVIPQSQFLKNFDSLNYKIQITVKVTITSACYNKILDCALAAARKREKIIGFLIGTSSSSEVFITDVAMFVQGIGKIYHILKEPCLIPWNRFSQEEYPVGWVRSNQINLTMSKEDIDYQIAYQKTHKRAVLLVITTKKGTPTFSQMAAFRVGKNGRRCSVSLQISDKFNFSKPHKSILKYPPGVSDPPPLNLLSVLEKKQVRMFSSFTQKGNLQISLKSGTAPVLPANIVLILDCSGSMTGESLCLLEKALHSFVWRLRPDDKLSIVTFGSSAQVLIQDKSKQDLYGKIPTLTKMGGRNYAAALKTTLNMLRRSFSVPQSLMSDTVHMIAKTALFMSTGQPTEEEPWKSYISQFSEYGYTLHAIGIGNDVDPNELLKLAEETGGLYTHADNNHEIGECLKKFLLFSQQLVYSVPKLKMTVFPDVTIYALNLVAPPRLLLDEARTGIHEILLPDIQIGQVMELIFEVQVDNPRQERKTQDLIEWRLVGTPPEITSVEWTKQELTNTVAVKRINNLTRTMIGLDELIKKIEIISSYCPGCGKHWSVELMQQNHVVCPACKLTYIFDARTQEYFPKKA
ncbi:MAG: VWA domain-containing protein, partial [Candidatus Hodarchaeota archaeon]